MAKAAIWIGYRTKEQRIQCSNCGTLYRDYGNVKFLFETWHYCPHCGAEIIGHTYKTKQWYKERYEIWLLCLPSSQRPFLT